jgi:hypothetical protein
LSLPVPTAESVNNRLLIPLQAELIVWLLDIELGDNDCDPLVLLTLPPPPNGKRKERMLLVVWLREPRTVVSGSLVGDSSNCDVTPKSNVSASVGCSSRTLLFRNNENERGNVLFRELSCVCGLEGWKPLSGIDASDGRVRRDGPRRAGWSGSCMIVAAGVLEGKKR